MVVVKIASFEIFRFRLPLRRPLILREHRLTERTGLVIRLKDKNDHTALGEISPLPGFSSEDMTQVEAELAKLQAMAMECDVPNDLVTLSGGFERWLGSYNLAPSVRFGFETAVLGLFAGVQDMSICQLISDAPLDYVSINGLLTGSRDAIMKKADKLLEMGYRAFKLKVGRNSVHQDISIIRDLKRLIGDDTVLRLDANRAWDIDQAVAFSDALAETRIDYVEEPVQTLPLLRRLMDEMRLPLPVALDESLPELTPDELPSLRTAKAVILKPTLLGFEKAIRFARSAETLGITPVVSSAFESSVGLAMLAQMAASVNKLDVPAGLDTLDWFEEDLLVDSLGIERGRLHIASLPDPVKELRQDMLREI
jgi:O-succinylbenzoate synthase